jgi:hypothetical protein
MRSSLSIALALLGSALGAKRDIHFGEAGGNDVAFFADDESNLCSGNTFSTLTRTGGNPCGINFILFGSPDVFVLENCGTADFS